MENINSNISKEELKRLKRNEANRKWRASHKGWNNKCALKWYETHTEQASEIQRKKYIKNKIKKAFESDNICLMLDALITN